MAGTNDWNNTLFGCFDDLGICCYGYWCTPCLFGSNSEKIDGKNCVLMCCAYSILAECYLCWLPHYYARQKLRQKYNLRENPSCGDCPTTLCCGPCALCQEAREMKQRGINPVVVQQPYGNAPVMQQPYGNSPAMQQPSGNSPTMQQPGMELKH